MGDLFRGCRTRVRAVTSGGWEISVPGGVAGMCGLGDCDRHVKTPGRR